MALSLDTSRPFRSLDELTKLVQAISTAPLEESEPDWLEWKREADLRDKRSPAVIAKFIAGFSNRDPVTAKRQAGGCAYLVIGAEPGSVHGVEPVDNAQLQDGISRFVRTSVRWNPQYVQHEEKQVLVITVEPPESGDLIAAMLTDYQGHKPGTRVCREGDVFVRRHGSTSLATQTDYDMLARRFAARAEQASGIRVEPVGPVTAVPVACGPDKIAAWRQREERALLASLEKRTALPGLVAALESRTPEEYRRAVAAYLDNSAPVLPNKARAEALIARDPAMQLILANTTERNFTAVQVEVTIDGDVWAFGSPEEAEPEMPARPPAWGVPAGFGQMIRGFDLPTSSAALVTGMYGPFIDNSGSTRIEFKEIDLRPKDKIELDPIYLVVDATLAGTTLTIHWKATSTSADGVSEGEFTVTVSSEIVSPLDE